MRIYLSAFATISTIFLALPLLAQQSTEKSPMREGNLEGFRIALVKPVVSINADRRGQTVKGGLQESIGMSIGYIRYNHDGVGWGTNFMFANLVSPQFGSFGNLTRVDLNVVKGADEIHIKGGLNVSTIANNPFVSRIAAGIGYQVSLGFMLTKNLGLDLGYVEMNQSGSYDMKETGPEFNLSATF